MDWRSKEVDNLFFLLLGSYKDEDDEDDEDIEGIIGQDIGRAPGVSQGDISSPNIQATRSEDDARDEGDDREEDEEDEDGEDRDESVTIGEDDGGDEDDVADEDDVTPHLEEETDPLGDDEFSTPGHFEDTCQGRVAYGIIVHAALEPGGLVCGLLLRETGPVTLTTFVVVKNRP